MALEPAFVHFDDVRPFALAEGVTGRPLFGDGAMLNVIEFEPGAVVPLHSHPHEQLGLVLRGMQALVVEGVAHELGPMDGTSSRAASSTPPTAGPRGRSCSTSSSRCARTTGTDGSAHPVDATVCLRCRSCASERRRTTSRSHGEHYPPGWDVPAYFNFTRDVVETLSANPLRSALTFVDREGIVDRRTFARGRRRRCPLGAPPPHAARSTAIAWCSPSGNVPAWHGAMLGALKSGLVSVPCTNMLRARDLAFRVRDSQARLVVADRSLEVEVEEMRHQIDASVSVLYLDEAPDEDSGGTCPSHRPRTRAPARRR